MAITETEALASVRILVAIANADGNVHEDERRSLAAALESLELPITAGTTTDALLAEKVDVEAELRALVSPEAREQIFRSAFFMAHADGHCTASEQLLLEQIAVATDTPDETRRALERMFVTRASGGEARVTVLSLTPAAAVDDPVLRAASVKKLALRYAVLAAALGAFPIPGLAIATDLGVVALQLKMIRDVGGLWGHVVDKAAAKSVLYGVGLGTGARLAVNNLAKLLPGWGSVIGATTSFVSTYALATVIEKVFASGQAASTVQAESLRAQFRAAEEEARAVYADHHDVVIQSQRQHKTIFDALTAKLAAGEITQAELDEELALLAQR